MLIVSTKARINGLKPEMALAFTALYQASVLSGLDIVVTHARDGLHSAKSLHYVCYAIDADVKGTIADSEIQSITQAIRRCLTPEFDLVTERRDGVFSYWHIEFQPKSSTGDRLYA